MGSLHCRRYVGQLPSCQSVGVDLGQGHTASSETFTAVGVACMSVCSSPATLLLLLVLQGPGPGLCALTVHSLALWTALQPGTVACCRWIGPHGYVEITGASL